MQQLQLRSALAEGRFDSFFQHFYPEARQPMQRARYTALLRFPDDGQEVFLFSAPGRTEIGGNHTDHQQGRVLAAGVTLDAIAAVTPLDGSLIRIHSDGHGDHAVDCSDLAVHPAEANTTAALIRGICAGMRQNGHAIGGFEAYVSSEVLPGSGLSSSAAFEVLLGTIVSHLYNGGTIAPVELAQIGQYAENVYFGKPSGLMDQCACALGGFCAIDFRDPAHPLVEAIPCDPAAFGYCLCLVDAGGSHANLTDEYAAIPAEMRSVAEALGGTVLRDSSKADFYAALPTLRGRVSDRALLRAMHFYDDNDWAKEEADALKRGDFDTFLACVRRSGRSSLDRLQNIYPACDVGERSVCLALALADRFLDGQGACRVHGGGFAGTMQAFVPLPRVSAYQREMEAVFGPGTCHLLSVRPAGGVLLTADEA